MSTPRNQEVLDKIAASASESEKAALIAWSDRLLTIYESDASKVSKLKDVIAATSNATTIKTFVAVIGKELTPSELQQLSSDLAVLQKSDLPTVAKIKSATSLVSSALKDLAWDNRGLPARMGISAAILTAVAFGSQGAGIAALGTAIGVPLWVVFGAGAAFLGEMYERLTGKRHSPTTTHRIIESTREDQE